MDDYDKLNAMLQHWLEHNDEHADTYVKWAEKPSVLSIGGLPELLNRISAETKKISGLFSEAIALLKKD
ncbi:hypothetical protein [Candidatus Magnetominusculus dajiuhuensis]|uniref:hypothetical protein n=1 Tax=Candidatus Magnetominusculus dajiuhuensis TaxID=3137712 RepID=UPI003B42B001